MRFFALLIAFLLPAFVGQFACLLAQPYNTLHWRIEGNGLNQPSYLYGTMHSRNSRVHNLGDSVLVSLSACKAVALEIVTDKMGIKDMVGAMKQMYMRDTTLKDLYDAETYQRVKKAVSQKLGFMTFIYNVDKIKPMFLASLLTEMDAAAEELPKSELILDMYFQEEGKKQRKQLISIESVREQMQAIDKLPLKVQAEMLLEQVNNAGSYDAMGEDMIEYYARQDLDALLELYEGQKESVTESFDRALVIDRNKTMAYRMDSFMRKQPTFTAVGALHLPGKTGVIALLRQKGYRVLPVYSSDKTYQTKTVVPKPALPDTSSAVVYERPFALIEAEEAGFQVLMPDSAMVEWMEDDMILYIYNDRPNGLFYSIAYSAIPDSLAITNEEFYNLIAERLAKSKGAVITYQNKVQILEVEAQEGQLALGEMIPNSHMRFVMLRKGKSFYLLSVTGAERKLTQKEVNTFFDSFMTFE